MFSAMKKWLLFLATGSFLLQAAGGCDSQLQATLLGGAQTFVNGVIGLYVDTAVSSLFNT